MAKLIVLCLLLLVGCGQDHSSAIKDTEQDKVEIVGVYCVKNHTVIHYNVKRYHPISGKYDYKRAAHGNPQEFHIVIAKGC